ncbi:hypothetical protein BPT24_213 [Tenacibaculum phage pT24]|uniref:Uncharacterized protein n=1 Tax=Tenacibaculum phage pT24 TaxID=1880590 RepID=A0A1B4XX15_9CAUD|nr:hypothetical protein HYP10_gp213 [Tenacibaculum phage pT24]BAV39337.1 hypothetical protein BPT24_213 [Tenacibaculum phage pT24]
MSEVIKGLVPDYKDFDFNVLYCAKIKHNSIHINYSLMGEFLKFYNENKKDDEVLVQSKGVYDTGVKQVIVLWSSEGTYLKFKDEVLKKYS